MKSRMTILGLALVAITSLTAAIGCSGGSGSGGDGVSNPDVGKGLDPENNQRMIELTGQLKDLVFKCENSGTCPKNVGMIAVNFDGDEGIPGKGQCTGFLVANNIVATNSHCVPPHLKNGSRPCAADLAIRFLEDGTGETLYSCEKILSFSGHKVRTPDYAFFEINPTKRTPFNLDQEKIPDGDLTVTKIKPLRGVDGVGGVMQTVHCRTTYNSFLNISAVSAWSPTGLLIGCSVEEGNSGSPVMNDAGAVVGILQAGVVGNFKSLLKDLYPKYKMEMSDANPGNAHFTNLACVEIPGHPVTRIKECEAAAKLTLNECSGMDNPENEKMHDSVLQNFKKYLPKEVIFELMSDQQQTTATPVCVKPGQNKISVPFPHVLQEQITWHIDDSIRLNPRVDFTEGSRTMSRLELVKTNGVWSGEIRQPSSYLGLVPGDFESSLSLSECTVDQLSRGNYEMIRKSDKQEINREQALAEPPKPETAYCHH